ncbi:hypothetical protein [Colwellia sp. 12G3]|uniref:hypothetical protein n=1 Tax=Colwellia sp. 12G3 TaxID=2058299 RepID=UPI0012FE8B92|nr:hypothetical protein [Colwellia sp. 12G3]
MKNKFELISRYLYRTLVKMFTPKMAKEFQYLLEDLKENEESLGRKIDQAHASLTDTSRLIEKLESELNLKIDKVTQLKVEYKRYSVLANLEEDKARALLTQLDLSLNKGKTSERVIAFFINLIAGVLIFIAGVWLSPHVTAFFHGVSGT